MGFVGTPSCSDITSQVQWRKRMAESDRWLVDVAMLMLPLFCLQSNLNWTSKGCTAVWGASLSATWRFMSFQGADRNEESQEALNINPQLVEKLIVNQKHITTRKGKTFFFFFWAPQSLDTSWMKMKSSEEITAGKISKVQQKKPATTASFPTGWLCYLCLGILHSVIFSDKAWIYVGITSEGTSVCCPLRLS